MKKDKLFSELLELSIKVQEIALTDDMQKLFGDEHISRNGGLVLASFLPTEIQTEFYKYMNSIALEDLSFNNKDSISEN